MIRQHPRFQHTAIIFISAVHLTDLDRLQGYQRGAVDYISVPVIPELLRAKVSVFAELHRKTRQLETLNQDLRKLSSALIVTQDEERRRIARELHDGLGQELSAAKMMLDGIMRPDLSTEWKEKAAADSSTLIDRAIQQVRSMSHLLHPPLLEEMGLPAALRWCAEGFTQRSGIAVAVDLPPEFGRLPMEVENALYRIVQECLSNVQRHSGSPTARIALQRTTDGVELEVRDQGRGMPVALAVGDGGGIENLGLGLLGMRERVRQLGGSMTINSTTKGSTVRVAIGVPHVEDR